MLLSFYVILYRTAMAEAKSEVNKTRHFVSMIPLHVLNLEVDLYHSHLQHIWISCYPMHVLALSITNLSRNLSPSCASSYQTDRRRRNRHPLVGTADRNPSKTLLFFIPLGPARVGVNVERGADGSGQNRSWGGPSCTLKELCDWESLMSGSTFP